MVMHRIGCSVLCCLALLFSGLLAPAFAADGAGAGRDALAPISHTAAPTRVSTPTRTVAPTSRPSTMPTPTPVPGRLAKLPITYPVLDLATAAYFNQTATASQVALVVNANVLPAITTGLSFWGDPSWTDAQPRLGGIVRQNHIKGFVYNAEHWTATPLSEQNNLASTVKSAGQVVHGLGLQFWVVPDDAFAETTITSIAQNADVIVLQGQRYETSPSSFQAFMVPLIAQAKAANPAVKVYAQVDFIAGTPQQALAALEAVDTFIDGIAVYVSSADLSNLASLQALIAQH
jgi:hypothetical protein